MQHLTSRSETVQKIIKSLNLTRPLYVSSILIGEPYTGKRTLIRELFPDLPVADGRDQESVENLLQETDALVIVHYESLANTDRLDFDQKHVIAIADYAGNSRALDETFAFIYTLPPLRERPEDIELYTELYTREAQDTFMIDEPVMIDKSRLDISQNLRSLRASVYREIFLQNVQKSDLEYALYHHFIRTLPRETDYHQNLGLFEKPLLEAGLRLFGSQLRLAEALGINRNTLRKKVHAWL